MGHMPYLLMNMLISLISNQGLFLRRFASLPGAYAVFSNKALLVVCYFPIALPSLALNIRCLIYCFQST